MRLAHSLRIGPREVVALVGAGGKSTLMFRLAAELAAAGRRVVTTMTTKLCVHQVEQAPAWVKAEDEEALLACLPGLLAQHGHVLLAGGALAEEEKLQGVDAELVDRLAAQGIADVLLVEADGSRRLPFKAPAAHEPVIPASATLVVPVVGLDVLGQPLDSGHVHRPERVAALVEASLGEAVTPAMVARVLAHPAGGAKGLPDMARLVPFLNKVTDETMAPAQEIAKLLLAHSRVEGVVLGAALEADPVREVWGRVGAIVLAAGEARRFGAPKQVMPWQGMPLVAYVAAQALRCPDISRVVVTVGAQAERVRQALVAGAMAIDGPVAERHALQAGLAEGRLRVVEVADWAQGQSRSVRAGLQALVAHSASFPREGLAAPAMMAGASGHISAAVFLLADQPGVSPALLSALIQRYRETLAPVVAPRHGGRRGNPVLFDRRTFPAFASLEGDIGARPIVEAYAASAAWVEWPTPEVLQDVDTLADYSLLKAASP